MKKIAVHYSHVSLRDKAERLASRLKLPLSDTLNASFIAYLVLTPDRLELQAAGAEAPGPVTVDFLSGKYAHRRRFGGGRRQLIGRAVGIKPKQRLTVLDVAAGLGRDAYVLAGLGCDVTMLERSPIIAALLRDGLERAQSDPSFAALSMHLIEADSRRYMQSLSEDARPDVIYLDPMFPSSKKSALAKKEMRLLKTVLGEENISVEMLALALKAALRRVVVKRSRHASSIEGPEPDLVFEGKSTRFDVYLTRGL